MLHGNRFPRPVQVCCDEEKKREQNFFHVVFQVGKENLKNGSGGEDMEVSLQQGLVAEVCLRIFGFF